MYRRALTVLAVLVAGPTWVVLADPVLTLVPASGQQGGDLTISVRVMGTGQSAGINGRVRIPKGLHLGAVTNGDIPTDKPEKRFGNAKVVGTSEAPELAFIVSFRDGRGLLTAPGTLVSFHFGVAADAPTGAFPVTFVEGSTAVANADGSAAMPHTVQGANVTIRAASLPTDINADGQTNALDIQLVVNAVLGIAIGGLDADVNNDGSVNALDVQRVVNAVLGLG